MASKLTDSSSNHGTAKRVNRRSSTSTAVDHDRCCSVGIIDGNTQTTMEPTNILQAAASLCCPSITGLALDTARHSNLPITPARVALRSIGIFLPQAGICKAALMSIQSASACGALH